ncbi:hypothetical protein PPL_10900 [Heterostelium album PN500]|uniref:F-box domain-containing protein n=1 Tax=Heterostelium pallidum (strain ATCC 26659 / Pp 5 / PN500) TaxID=670386 RepID=D3BSA8_HETP5|nr:hypothetical protein PPL_10900 [Heterostelium album PN500]EFA75845.1 hypothetical protein PPL_10900 [Heterostelium album PN500]|eukprot:XP_020427979.1 hypothetical protein PPL_10900 [Heterostelium album PN500]
MNNQTDKIVNLSHLILNKIVSYLEYDIDIICFSLVCKRWYNDRDKYLVFNTNNINLFTLNTTDINQNHKHFNLPSYNNILLKSIQSKTKCTLIIGKIKYYTFDYHYDDVRNLKSIPNNVSVIDITTNEYTEDDMEYLYRLISESQSVTKLKGCNTLKYGLPKSIKSIKFKYNFNEQLVKGSLPNTLEVLDFEDPLKQEIPPGVLPDSLRKLSLYNYQYEFLPGVLPSGLSKIDLNNYQHTILPGVLPSGLRYLNLHNYELEILPGVLPDVLQKFTLDGYRHEFQPGVLPSSLKSLSLTNYTSPLKADLRYSIDSTSSEDCTETESYLPISWLQAISSLSSLQSLYIFLLSSRQDTTISNLNYLPPTLESLDIRLQGKENILKGAMPTSLKSIHTVGCRFNIDEIFPETLQYHLEIFYYRNDSFPPITSNIKIDSLSVSSDPRQSKIILPTGIRTINLYMKSLGSDENNIDFGFDGVADQTCSLRELRLPTFVDGPPKFKLPTTIEHLDIGNNDLNDILHLIPSTLNTLEFEKLSNNNISIPNTIKLINNIIYRFTSFQILSNNNISIPNTIKLITNIIYRFKPFQILSIRKLDDNYYLLYSENQCSPKGKLIARIFHQSKLEQIFSKGIE